jgi:pyruvate formate-lyase activating enzyme-like uncharacterized protein
VKGEKTVLFVTGICPRHCAYCPISDKKSQKDVTYANEWPTSNIKDIIREAELCGSKGAGFTGGDPLTKIHRTTTYIKALKNHFGKNFHIHLYTSFDLISDDCLKTLHDAGLDEIRFHPDLDTPLLWDKITTAKKFDWDVGVEIPAIPGKKEQILRLMEFMDGKIDFLNINELEISDAKANLLTAQGYKTKDALSYGVNGSEQLALFLLKHAQKNNLKYSIHYCTAKLKDKVQLANRLKKRAKNIKQPFDILNNDGTLTRGAIYLSYLAPSFEYAAALSALTSKQKLFSLKKLRLAENHLLKEYDIPRAMLYLDVQRFRIVTNPGVVLNLKEELKSMTLKPAIVTEYPTWDALVVELEWV